MSREGETLSPDPALYEVKIAAVTVAPGRAAAVISKVQRPRTL